MKYQHLKFSLKELDLNKSELLQIFGNQDNEILNQSDWERMLYELQPSTQMEGGYYIYEDIHFNKERKTITIGNITFNIGPVLFPRFKNVEKIAVTISTAGAYLDSLSKSYIEKGEVFFGYAIDALGAVIVEKVLQGLRESLRNSMHQIDYSITGCYCPGYCDWPLTEQKKIFKLLPEKFCNVLLSDSCLMVPLKSISGLIGIGINVQEDFPQCRICTLDNCYMRKEAYAVQS